MHVWVTRSQPGADQTAARLRALGHDPLISPVLEVQALAADPPDLRGVAALAFTSANAVRAFVATLEGRDGTDDPRRLPVFAVGDATAEAARAHGFASLVSADGDVAALAEAITRAVSTPGSMVLHPCGLDVAGDLAGDLSRRGIAVRDAALYRAVGVTALAPAVVGLLDTPGATAILVHSPKAACIVRSLLEAQASATTSEGMHTLSASGPPISKALSRRLACCRLVALSPACAAPLVDLPFAAVVAASAPREDALLQALSG